MNVGHWWNNTVRKSETRTDKSIAMPLCPPQIQYRLIWDQNQISAVTGRRLTNHLKYLFFKLHRGITRAECLAVFVTLSNIIT